jgi:hypothetical protein
MPTMASLMFIAFIALVSALYVPEQELRANTAIADAAATSFLSYRESVIDYLNSHPGTASVTVPDASLTFAWGYQRDARWTHYVPASGAGALVVYEATANTVGLSTMLDQLYRKTDKSFSVGRKSNISSGTLISANGFATGIILPSIVPDGAIAMVGQ